MPGREGSPREGGSGSRASTRLQRLLVVVPYVVRHPGTTLEELSRLFGADRIHPNARGHQLIADAFAALLLTGTRVS